MKKITRVEALKQVSEAIQENDYVRANKILEIIDKSIATDKKRNTYTSEIELQREDKKYFRFNKL